MRLTLKTIVVTGAGSGIGQQLVLQLLTKDARVAGVDINSEALARTGELAGVGEDRFKPFCLDITDEAAVVQFPAQVLSHFGAVDGLINNAGIIQPFRPVSELSAVDIRRVMNVNFYGTVNLTKAFLPFLLERPEAHIANVSSMGGFLAVPGQTIYGAAKAAVKLFTEGLYAELLDTPVRVTVVFPGAIATNISENSGLERPKSGGASKLQPLPAPEAARLMLAGIEQNKFRVLVGRDARVLDWLYRFNPRYALGLIQKKMKTLRGNS